MKHNLKVTLILVVLFLIAQLVGLVIIHHYSTLELPLGMEKPQVDSEYSYFPLLIGIALATVLALVLLKFRAFNIWKGWFFLSVLFALTISFGVFLDDLVALVLAAILAGYKIFKPNMYIHNLTEIFIYGGLAAIFVPILSIQAVFILFIVIAIYDMIAVWKTKHMIKMAKFQTESKVFAGLSVGYKPKKIKGSKLKKVQNAILGGGDIGIPLIFSGVVLLKYGLAQALITILFSTIAIGSLFIFAKKKKFYPAIPFLLIGCAFGFLISLLI